MGQNVTDANAEQIVEVHWRQAAEVDCANLFGLSETVDVHDKHDKRKPQPVEDIVFYFVMLHLGLVYLNNAAKL